MLKRRHFSSLALLALPLRHARASSENTGAAGAPELRQALTWRLREIERDGGGTLGVQILDTATGARFGHRADERFLMCSTFKMLASALVLHRVDQGKESLARRVVFRTADLESYSPITEQHAAGEGMTMAALCEAAITYSDNTAANLILASYGGPPAFTAYARSLGDTVTRLSHVEPALNTWHGPDSDTTSPRAMQQSLQRVALGDALSPASREQLQRWLFANTTGAKRLKAGLPPGWRIGDKTGSAGGNGGLGASNDIAVVWPPGRAPLVVTAYLTQSKAASDVRDAALAQLGQLLPLIVERTPTR